MKIVDTPVQTDKIKDQSINHPSTIQYLNNMRVNKSINHTSFGE